MIDSHVGLSNIEVRNRSSQIIHSPNDTQASNRKGSHLSAWDFSQHLHKILGPEPNEQPSRSIGCLSKPYKIPLRDETFLNSLESVLPPKHRIIHLAHVVDFHTNANCCFFSITAFVDQINKVDEEALNTISDAWNMKILLIAALGKLFLEKGATVSGPPGIGEFLQALRHFQPHSTLDEDPVMVVGNLCLLVLYAHAADMHRMAYLYVRDPP
jgi:hypothetical protein